MHANLWILLPLLLAAQAPPMPAPPTTPEVAAQPPSLVPGELPASASPEARAAWGALVAATTAKAQGGVRAFDMTFDVTVRQDGQSNEFPARYRYLEEGERRFVRVTPLSGQSEHLRGPDGDFVVLKGQSTRIEGREMKEDKRELEEKLAIARTFVGLSDPRRLRIARLELEAGPPAQLPAALAASAAGLRWLKLSSPDFQRGQGDSSLYRVHLGLDGKTHLPTLAIVAREQGPAIELETAQLLELGNYAELDGFRIPREVRAYQPDTTQVPWMFGALPVLDLYFSKGTLKAPLKREDFLPPARKG